MKDLQTNWILKCKSRRINEQEKLWYRKFTTGKSWITFWVQVLKIFIALIKNFLKSICKTSRTNFSLTINFSMQVEFYIINLTLLRNTNCNFLGLLWIKNTLFNNWEFNLWLSNIYIYRVYEILHQITSLEPKTKYIIQWHSIFRFRFSSLALFLLYTKML